MLSSCTAFEMIFGDLEQSRHRLPKPLLGAQCTYWCWANNLFAMTSALLEVHIALTTAVAVRRNRKVACLSRGLVCAWPLGFALGACVIYFDKLRWDSSVHKCNADSVDGEYLKGAVLASGVAICSTCYIYSAIFVKRDSSMAVTTRLWNRAKYYTLVSIFTNAPFCIYTFSKSEGVWLSKSQASEIGYLVAFATLTLKGFLNVVVYAAQCRYVRCASQRGHHLGLEGGASLQNIKSSSFSVVFSSTEVEPVQNVHAEAAARTRGDIVALMLSEGAGNAHAEASAKAREDIVTLMLSEAAESEERRHACARIAGMALLTQQPHQGQIETGSKSDSSEDAFPSQLVQNVDEDLYSIVLGCFDYNLDISVLQEEAEVDEMLASARESRKASRAGSKSQKVEQQRKAIDAIRNMNFDMTAV